VTTEITEERLMGRHKGLVQYIEIQANMYREHTVFGDSLEAPIRLATVYDWFLKNAVLLEGMNIELSDSTIEDSLLCYHPEVKQCYYNSMMMPVMVDNSLEYWEGWATALIPCNHAWNVKDGKVVDTTWSLLDHQREKAEDIAYFGIKIPTAFVMEQLRVTTRFKQANQAGPFLWDYAVKCIIEEKKEHLEECEKYFAPQEEE
jgi:hypothetical protein